MMDTTISMTLTGEYKKFKVNHIAQNMAIITNFSVKKILFKNKLEYDFITHHKTAQSIFHIFHISHNLLCIQQTIKC